MDNLEQYLDRVCRGLGGASGLRRHLRQELREHIQEAVERYKAGGLPAEEALQKAIEDFGEPAAVRDGLQDVYGRDLMGVLIEKAMQWKEQTMKAKWLWSWTASLFLLVAIFAQGFFAFCVLWLIAPKLKEMFKDLGEELPKYCIAFLAFAWQAFSSAWIWIPLLLIAWGLFEWRCRSENKPLIRLSGLALVSLVTTGLAWWAGIAAVVPLLDVQGYLYVQHSEKVMLRNALKADEAMTHLDSAVKVQDWKAAEQAAEDYGRSLGWTETQGSAPAGLVSMGRPQRMEEIRGQLRVLTALSRQVASAAQYRNSAQLREHSQQLREAYEQLKALVGQ